MMKLTLAGLNWQTDTPSQFHLPDVKVTIWFNGKVWIITYDGEDGEFAFPTRDLAAQMIADGINAFNEEQLA